ncbi:hypothetical protein [Cysteiniphilum litorale]
MQVRQIKMIAQCCAFLMGCFCGGKALAEIKDYNASVTLDIIEKSAKDDRDGLSLQTDTEPFTITLPKIEIASRSKSSKKYIVYDSLNYENDITLHCDGIADIPAKIIFSYDKVKSKLTGNKHKLSASPILKLDTSLINHNGIKICKLNDQHLALKKLVAYGTDNTFKIDITLNIAPYISITNKTIDAELTKQDSGDYTKQVEIPVETNANNIQLTLSSCTHSNGNTCQLKHKDTDHKIPIHIHHNDGNNEIIIGNYITKSGLSDINNKFILDLTTKKDDMDNAKAGKYEGKISLKLEASF